MLRDDQIALPGLGSFRNVSAAERQDYHASTGMPIAAPASPYLNFEPSLTQIAGAPRELHQGDNWPEHIDVSDDALVAELEGFKRGFADVDGTRLHYVEGGLGTPVILMPCYP